MSKTSKKRSPESKRKCTRAQSGKKKSWNCRKKRVSSGKSLSAKRIGPSRYTFYSILNTSFAMDRGSAAANIARGFLALCFKLDENDTKAKLFDKWVHTGEKIVILKGYDHKHLKYLRDEVQYSAIDSDTLYKKWGCERAILVLTVFGQEEELEDTFDGLSFLR